MDDRSSAAPRGRRRSGRYVSMASGRAVGQAAGAGREDVAVLELEVDVARLALGQSSGPVAGPAGIRDGLAAEEAVDDEAELLGGRLLAGLGLDLEAEPADHRQRLARAGGDLMADLMAGHGYLRPARAPVSPAPARTDPAAGAHD